MAPSVIMNNDTNRPLCEKCKGRYRAVAYTRPSGQTQYRSLCEHCLKLKKTGRLSRVKTSWEKGGYKKKTACDICGFKSKYTSQITVWHVNGNLNDSSLVNLRCVCLNCVEAVKRRQATWQIGDLTPD